MEVLFCLDPGINQITPGSNFIYTRVKINLYPGLTDFLFLCVKYWNTMNKVKHCEDVSIAYFEQDFFCKKELLSNSVVIMLIEVCFLYDKHGI
jgi:hypothetical protein